MLSPFSRIFNSKAPVPGSQPPTQQNSQSFEDLLLSSLNKASDYEMRLKFDPCKLLGFCNASSTAVVASSGNIIATQSIGGLGMDVQSSEMMATDLQDLSTQASPDATNPDVLAAANTVSHEEAANALVTEKEVNNPSSMDVQRQLDSSGYLSVAPAGNEVSDSNSPESNTQSFLSYLQDHANTGTSVVAGGTSADLFNTAATAAQLAAAYPYNIYEGNSYAPLTNSPLSSLTGPVSGVVSGNSVGGSSTSGQQFVSYNGDTYLIQTSPNGTHQLVASLNGATAGRSMSPTNPASGAGNLLPLEKPFSNNGGHTTDTGAPTSSTENGTPQISSNVQSYITRVSPTTIQWLIQNYETAEGVSLPRSTLYSHYQRHCAETKQEPVNAASFGKLIRSVFLGLRTRRIGTRGNSKYHYYGIRVKPTSILNEFHEDTSIQQQPEAGQPTHYNGLQNNGSNYQNYKAMQVVGKKKMNFQTVTAKVSSTASSLSGNSASNVSGAGGQDNLSLGGQTTQTNNADQQALLGNGASQQMKQYLGNYDLQVIPDFPTLEMTDKSVCIDVENGLLFESSYKEHCLSVVKAISDLNFTNVEQIWRDYWSKDLFQSPKSEEHNKENEVSTSDQEQPQTQIKKASSTTVSAATAGTGMSVKRQKIPVEELASLLQSPDLQNFVQEADYALYQYIVDILLPKVLKPIPNSLTQCIRSFSKNLEGWLNSALNDVLPEQLKAIKITAVRSLAQTLRRYTGLNHLAQAARAVLQNSSQVNQMLSDLNKVDFANVQDQAGWVCLQCDPSLVSSLESEFKRILGAPADLETWAQWLQSAVNKALENVKAKETLVQAARQFLLNWSFYSSMVIRDLTLRSAASFGSFHLIRLLYDEYVFYLVEQKVAQVLHKSPVAVMGLQQFRTTGKTSGAPSSTMIAEKFQEENEEVEEEEEEEETEDEIEQEDGEPKLKIAKVTNT